MLIQSETQLASIYGTDNAKTIINNCDTYIYLGGMDIATASLCAATAIGFGSLWLGKAIRCPMTALYIPALLPMVPGIYAYKTVFSLLMFLQSLDDTQQGLAYMQQFFLNATVSFSVIIMLAAGATLPIFIFNRRAFSLTRRKSDRI